MQLTARQHTAFALILCCTLAAALHLGKEPMTAQEINGISTQYSSYPLLEKFLYSTITHKGIDSPIQIRAISILFSAVGLTFSWLIARRIVSSSLALSAPAFLAGSSAWNDLARTALPYMAEIAITLAIVWMVLLPKECYFNKLQRFAFPIKCIVLAILFFTVPIPLHFSKPIKEFNAINFVFDIHSASFLSNYILIASLPFVLWFIIVARNNAKNISKNRNTLILLTISIVLLLLAFVFDGVWKQLWMPFSIIAGIRLFELAFSAEIPPKLGWFAMMLPYSILFNLLIVHLLGSEHIGFGQIAVIGIIWGMTSFVGFILPNMWLRNWLARATISAGIIIPLILILNIMNFNMKRSSSIKTSFIHYAQLK